MTNEQKKRKGMLPPALRATPLVNAGGKTADLRRAEGSPPYRSGEATPSRGAKGNAASGGYTSSGPAGHLLLKGKALAAEEILGREAFSYDASEDALYQQMVDRYAQQGHLAMLDTMGQAQAMTGGYGNSYAQSVGQQAYQGYLKQAADALPQYYQMALDRYDREGAALQNRYDLLAAQEAEDYSRYRDALADYYAQRDYAYQLGRDQVADSQWQAEFDEAVRQWEYTKGIADADGNRLVPSITPGTPQPENEEEEDEKQKSPSGGGKGNNRYHTML